MSVQVTSGDVQMVRYSLCQQWYNTIEMHLSVLYFAVLLAAACATEPLHGREYTASITPDTIDSTGCSHTGWPPSDVGKKLVPQAPTDELKEMLREIDPANIEAIIKKLVSFGTRHTLSQQNSSTRGIGAARDWIYSEFVQYSQESDGRLTASINGYTQGVANRIPFPTRISNVLATIKGETERSEERRVGKECPV